VRLWDAQAGTPGHTLSGHTAWVTSVVYSPSGHQIASSSQDKTVRLWNAGTGTPGPILIGHTDKVTSAVYSPSGHQVASGSHDNTVRLWNVHSGQCLAVVGDFHGAINSIVWNSAADGVYFATGSTDNSVRVWQVTGDEDNCHVRLHWSSMHGGLVLSRTTIHRVWGLSKINMQLLKQRGAEGEPNSPWNLNGANQNRNSVVSVISQLELASNFSISDSSSADSSSDE
jgi:WD40 repeat protein